MHILSIFIVTLTNREPVTIKKMTEMSSFYLSSGNGTDEKLTKPTEKKSPESPSCMKTITMTGSTII